MAAAGRLPRSDGGDAGGPGPAARLPPATGRGRPSARRARARRLHPRRPGRFGVDAGGCRRVVSDRRRRRPGRHRRRLRRSQRQRRRRDRCVRHGRRRCRCAGSRRRRRPVDTAGSGERFAGRSGDGARRGRRLDRRAGARRRQRGWRRDGVDGRLRDRRPGQPAGARAARRRRHLPARRRGGRLVHGRIGDRTAAQIAPQHRAGRRRRLRRTRRRHPGRARAARPGDVVQHDDGQARRPRRTATTLRR